ncbi:MAG: hypothetical protein U1E65_24525 [Myxococcota bacterium]
MRISASAKDVSGLSLTTHVRGARVPVTQGIFSPVQFHPAPLVAGSFTSHLVGAEADKSPIWASVRYGVEGLTAFSVLFPSSAMAIDSETVSRALHEVSRRGVPVESLTDPRRALWRAFVASTAEEEAPSLTQLLADPRVDRYSPEVKDAVTIAYAGLEDQAKSRLLELLADNDFFGDDAATQLQVLRAWVANSASVEGSDVIGTLAVTPGLKAMSAEERGRLLRYVAGTDNVLSTEIRASLSLKLLKPTFKEATPADQAATLSTFLNNEHGSPVSIPTWNAGFDQKRRTFVLSEPTPVPDYEFHSGKAAGQRYTLTVANRTINIVTADGSPEAGLYVHNAEQLAKAIAALPAASLAELSTVEIDVKRSPDDAHWAEVWHEPNFRAYMTAGENGVVHVYPSASPQLQHNVDGALIHETGHLWSRKVWGADGSAGWNTWTALMAKDGFHASAYARHNPAEDVADTVELYHIVVGTPNEASVRALLPARFKYLDGVVGQAESALTPPALPATG